MPSARARSRAGARRRRPRAGCARRPRGRRPSRARGHGPRPTPPSRARRRAAARSAPSCRIVASIPSRLARKLDSRDRLRVRMLARRRLVERLRGERLHQRGQRSGVVERRLRVHLAHLDGSEPRMGAHVPPDERVVVEVARPRPPRPPPARHTRPSRENARGHAASRVRAHDREARARQAGVRRRTSTGCSAASPWSSGRCRAARSAPDRRLRVGRADVHVQRALRACGGSGCASVWSSRAVALLVGQRTSPQRAVGCRPAAISVAPASARAAARAACCSSAGGLATRCGRPACAARPRTRTPRARPATPGSSICRQHLARRRCASWWIARIDQQQLLLHAEGERVGGSEGVLHGRGTYCAERGVARRSARTRARRQGRSRSRRSRCRRRRRPPRTRRGATRASLVDAQAAERGGDPGDDLDHRGGAAALRPARPPPRAGLDHLARPCGRAHARSRSPSATSYQARAPGWRAVHCTTSISDHVRGSYTLAVARCAPSRASRRAARARTKSLLRDPRGRRGHVAPVELVHPGRQSGARREPEAQPVAGAPRRRAQHQVGRLRGDVLARPGRGRPGSRRSRAPPGTSRGQFGERLAQLHVAARRRHQRVGQLRGCRTACRS